MNETDTLADKLLIFIVNSTRHIEGGSLNLQFNHLNRLDHRVLKRIHADITAIAGKIGEVSYINELLHGKCDAESLNSLLSLVKKSVKSKYVAVQLEDVILRILFLGIPLLACDKEEELFTRNCLDDEDHAIFNRLVTDCQTKA